MLYVGGPLDGDAAPIGDTRPRVIHDCGEHRPKPTTYEPMMITMQDGARSCLMVPAGQRGQETLAKLLGVYFTRRSGMLESESDGEE